MQDSELSMSKKCIRPGSIPTIPPYHRVSSRSVLVIPVVITVQTPFGEVSIYERGFTEVVALCELSGGLQFPLGSVPNPGLEVLFTIKMISETKEREVKIPSGYDV